MSDRYNRFPLDFQNNLAHFESMSLLGVPEFYRFSLVFQKYLVHFESMSLLGVPEVLWGSLDF